MNWKLKAYTQKVAAGLPKGTGYRLYYVLQKLHGTFKPDRLMPRLGVARQIVELARQSGRTVSGKIFFELGTGWTCGTPLGLWLCGVGKVITVDLNPYLKESLVLGELRYLMSHVDEVRRLFGNDGRSAVFQERLDLLCRRPPQTLADLWALTGVEYRPRYDARKTDLPDQAVDFYFSWYVLQHIPVADLRAIWKESARILRPEGLVVHCVDAGDQFTRADPTLSAINFLQFDAATWEHYAGNRFAWHNRLRASDHLALAGEQGFEILHAERKVDEASLKLIRGGFPLHPDFQGKTLEDLATIRVVFTAAKRGAAGLSIPSAHPTGHELK